MREQMCEAMRMGPKLELKTVVFLGKMTPMVFDTWSPVGDLGRFRGID